MIKYQEAEEPHKYKIPKDNFISQANITLPSIKNSFFPKVSLQGSCWLRTFSYKYARVNIRERKYSKYPSVQKL